MYRRDLTPLTGGEERTMRAVFGVRADIPLVCVGWLGTFRPHSKGESARGFRERLVELCTAPSVFHRGFFRCRQGACKLRLRSPRGEGEIVVMDDRQAFLAPSLVGHYVTHHDYLPPPAFIEAVLASAAPARVRDGWAGLPDEALADG